MFYHRWIDQSKADAMPQSMSIGRSRFFVLVSGVSINDGSVAISSHIFPMPIMLMTLTAIRSDGSSW